MGISGPVDGTFDFSVSLLLIRPRKKHMATKKGLEQKIKALNLSMLDNNVPIPPTDLETNM